MPFLSTSRISIAPSILNADFGHLAAQLRNAEAAGVEAFHLDIMDGHFVPNISFGPGIVARINELTELPLDVHLMISDPDFYLGEFIKAGADGVTVHLEACRNPGETLHRIREQGISAGAAISPDTRVASLAPYIEALDLILLMSVYPGFGGQKFIPGTVNKLQELKTIIGNYRDAILVEVDGGIDSATAPQVIAAGANVLVIGSAIFKQTDIGAAVKSFRDIISAYELQI